MCADSISSDNPHGDNRGKWGWFGDGAEFFMRQQQLRSYLEIYFADWDEEMNQWGWEEELTLGTGRKICSVQGDGRKTSSKPASGFDLHLPGLNLHLPVESAKGERAYCQTKPGLSTYQRCWLNSTKKPTLFFFPPAAMWFLRGKVAG